MDQESEKGDEKGNLPKDNPTKVKPSKVNPPKGKNPRFLTPVFYNSSDLSRRPKVK